MSLSSPFPASASGRLSAFFLMSLAMVGGASAATLSVGPGKTYAAPCAAFARAQTGDVIQIDGGKTYSGDVCAIGASNLTIRGVNGRPVIDAAGKNAQGKGTWVIQGNNVTVDNVEMAGASVPDRNGAALRIEGTNFTLRSSYLRNNENGILTGANDNSSIVIENTEFASNGRGDGYSHNVYIGHVGSLTFRYNYSHDANGGHNLKSRASVNTINYNRFSSSTGKPSYEIDLPNAGTSYVIGNVIHQPASHNNPGLLAYGMEGASNPGKDLYVVNNTFLNDDSVRGTFVVVGGSVTTPVLLQNNIFGGTGAATNQSNAIDRTNFRSLVPGFVNRAAVRSAPDRQRAGDQCRFDARRVGLRCVADASGAVQARGVGRDPRCGECARYRCLRGTELGQHADANANTNADPDTDAIGLDHLRQRKRHLRFQRHA